jgi:hypothetical protein
MAGSVEQELHKDTKVEQLTKRKLSRLAERLYIRTHLGDVAQLARALDWQSRGRRFEPDLLHVRPAKLEKRSGAFFVHIFRESNERTK